MPRDIEFSGRRMFEILDHVEPRLRRSFLLMIERIRGRLGQDAIARIIESGRLGESEALYEDAARAFAREVSRAFMLTGEAANEMVRDALDVVVGFDQFGERAVARIRESELSLIGEFVHEQRQIVSRVIQEGIARGTNPREQARQFRDSIGLTAKQQDSVENYRRALESGSRDALDRALRDRRFDPTVQRALSGGEPLSAAQIDAMVDRYRERFVKYRAETIARTESLRAVHDGLDESLRQIVDRADVPGEAVVRIWNTALDDRVRDIHQTMHGQEVGIDDPFVDGDGNELMFPGDPSAPPETTINCRCVASMRISAAKMNEQAVTVSA